MEVRFYQEEDRRQAATALLHSFTGGVSPEAPPVRNLDAVLELDETFRFEWRGQAWEMPPVSFKDGAQALVLARWIDLLREDPETLTPEEYEANIELAVGLATRTTRPAGWLRRIVYRWRVRRGKSPWTSATDPELGMLVGFVWRRRTRSPDRRL